MAVATPDQSLPLVIACNQEARVRGVQPGMTVPAALSLAPLLKVRFRDEAAEKTALFGIALWCGQFTPSVNVNPPDGVLLEVAASLRLFGGLPALFARVQQGLVEMGYAAKLACAPTALGAWLLARAGLPLRIRNKADLEQALSALPVTVLEQPQAVMETLLGIGARTLEHCLHLPREGLARRAGAGLLDQLDRAFGKIPDPRKFFVPPLHFESKLELPAEVSETEALVFAARRLVVELTGFLAARNAGIQRLGLTLFHPDHSPTQVSIGLVSPTRNPQHLMVLLRERLASLTLPAPVRSIALRAREIRPLQAPTLSLFPDAEQETENWTQLVERLRARLGAAAVQTISPVADHRPERAWRAASDILLPGTLRTAPRDAMEQLPFNPRPLWLLSEARPIREEKNRPCLNGPLKLLAGPERIETGWWDGRSVKRDYYVAENPLGTRFWIFWERGREGSWYLHGIFA